jgi:hypothetical protein
MIESYFEFICAFLLSSSDIQCLNVLYYTILPSMWRYHLVNILCQVCTPPGWTSFPAMLKANKRK